MAPGVRQGRGGLIFEPPRMRRFKDQTSEGALLRPFFGPVKNVWFSYKNLSYFEVFGPIVWGGTVGRRGDWQILSFSFKVFTIRMIRFPISKRTNDCGNRSGLVALVALFTFVFSFDSVF